MGLPLMVRFRWKTILPGSVIPTFVVTSLSINPPTLSVGDYAQLTATVQNTSTVAGAAKIVFTDGQSGPWLITTTTPVISPGMAGQNQPSEAVIQATSQGAMDICAYIVAASGTVTAVLPVGPYTNQQNATTSARFYYDYNNFECDTNVSGHVVRSG